MPGNGRRVALDGPVRERADRVTGRVADRGSNRVTGRLTGPGTDLPQHAQETGMTKIRSQQSTSPGGAADAARLPRH